MFFGKFSPEALGANVTVFLVDGGLNNQSVPGTEVRDVSLHMGVNLTWSTQANLDCQYTGCMN
jgi:hypothetical protein